MPKAVEDALKKAAAGLAGRGKLRKKRNETLQKAKKRFVYATMTNLQKKGSIAPWRSLKHGPST